MRWMREVPDNLVLLIRLIKILLKNSFDCIFFGLFKFFLAVDASVGLFLRICQGEDLSEFLLDGSDTARILALDDIDDLFRVGKILFLGNLAAADHIDRDLLADKTEHIKINRNIGLNLDDVLLAHLAACGIFDDGHLAIQLIQLEVIVNIHALSGRNMIDDITVFNSTDT